MLWISLTVALLTVVAGLALVSRPATAAPQLAQTAIDVVPRKEVYAVGDVVTVTVQLSNLVDFYAADLGWTFDAGSFQVVDANPNLAGVQVKPGDLFAGDSLLIQNLVDNGTGLIKFVGSRRNPEPPVSGSGTAAIVTFRAVGACGSTLLELKRATLTLSDNLANNIDYQEAIPFDLRTAACPYRQFLPHLSRGRG